MHCQHSSAATSKGPSQGFSPINLSTEDVASESYLIFVFVLPSPLPSPSPSSLSPPFLPLSSPSLSPPFLPLLPFSSLFLLPFLLLPSPLLHTLHSQFAGIILPMMNEQIGGTHPPPTHTIPLPLPLTIMHSQAFETEPLVGDHVDATRGKSIGRGRLGNMSGTGGLGQLLLAEQTPMIGCVEKWTCHMR